jgi:hypothetical protein
MKAGLSIRSVRMQSETELTCMVSYRDLKQLKTLGRNLYRFTVVGEGGVTIKARNILKNPALPIGCLLALALVLFQSFVVEAVEINGYKAIPETELRRVLEEYGIYEGAWRRDIDWVDAEKAIFDTFPQVTWVQLVYSGRLVMLNISETDLDILGKDVLSFPEKEGSGEKGEDGGSDENAEGDSDLVYTNIVARKSGYIESIYPYYGLALVEAGDYVEEGQVLITGCVPLTPTVFDEAVPSEYYINAKGEVWAKVPYHMTLNQERYVWGGVSGGTSGSDGDSGGGSDEKEEDAGRNLILNRVEKTQEQIEAKAEQQIRLWAEENLEEKAEILNKSLKFITKENIIEVSVTLEVRQQIGKTQEESIGEKVTDTQ